MLYISIGYNPADTAALNCSTEIVHLHMFTISEAILLLVHQRALTALLWPQCIESFQNNQSIVHIVAICINLFSKKKGKLTLNM